MMLVVVFLSTGSNSKREIFAPGVALVLVGVLLLLLLLSLLLASCCRPSCPTVLLQVCHVCDNNYQCCHCASITDHDFHECYDTTTTTSRHR